MGDHHHHLPDDFEELNVVVSLAHQGGLVEDTHKHNKSHHKDSNEQQESTEFKMATVCSPEMRKELRLAFDSVDDDKSGSISSEELYKLFHNFGVDIDQEETEELLQNLDMDGNGEIDFEEFVEIMMSAMEDEDEMIESSFREFDKNEDGFIELKELRYVLQCLGENSISDADMKQMIHNADYDNDGKVSLEDFRRMWKEY